MKERRKETGRHRVAALTRFPPPTTVILIDRSIFDYSLNGIEIFWRSILREECCPHCRVRGRFSRHGTYEKYHYQGLIPILRVRCRGCRKTHALIPLFSVPGTSIGLNELESFIIKRAEGTSRMEAGGLLRRHGFGTDYLRSLERRILTGIHRAKALLPGVGDHHLPAWQWLIEAAGTGDHPAYTLNTLSIAAGWGAVFCSLTPGAGRRTTKAGTSRSHDISSARMPGQPIDSG